MGTKEKRSIKQNPSKSKKLRLFQKGQTPQPLYVAELILKAALYRMLDEGV